MDSAEANRHVFDSVADEFISLSLMPPERNLLTLFGHRLAEMDMLDLGVGAGRTGYTFAPLVRNYVGLDYSARMIKRAHSLLGSGGGTELVLGDARDLSSLKKKADFDGFDLVLFSFCGIDAVGHADRLRILTEVRGVIKNIGHFLFSSHSMGTLPLSTEMPGPNWHRQSVARKVYNQLAGVRYARKARRSNRNLNLEAARQRGWVIFRDPAHDFQLDVYYVDPEYQVAQLREQGFEVEAIYDRDGNEIELPHREPTSWLDFLCTPTGGTDIANP